MALELASLLDSFPSSSPTSLSSPCNVELLSSDPSSIPLEHDFDLSSSCLSLIPSIGPPSSLVSFGSPLQEGFASFL